MKRKLHEDDTTGGDGGDVASSPSSTTTQPQPPPLYGRGKILLLGDSLTQLCFDTDSGSNGSSGWGSALADRYQRRADVLNRGLSGYNTRWFLHYALDDDDQNEGEEQRSHIWTEPGNVLLVTIFFGANDAALPDQGSARQHVPLEEYRENLYKLIDEAHEAYPTAKIIVITPPPVYGPQRLAWQKKRYGEQATGIVERTTEHTQHYAAVCTEVVSGKVPFPFMGKKDFRETVACMDLFTAMVESKKTKTKTTTEEEDATLGAYFYDGLHFSPAGHAFVYQLLLATIAQHFPDLVVTPCPVTAQANNSGAVCPGIPTNGPHHDDIGNDHAYATRYVLEEETRDYSSATSEERRIVQQIQQNIRDNMDKFIEQDKKK